MAIADRAVYATQARPLQDQIQQLLKRAPAHAVEGEILAVIVPDSNRLHGGDVAAEVYRTLQGQRFDTVILIAPSHSGEFRRIHICSLDTYRTPVGDLVVNDKVRNELCDEDDDIFLDDRGHFHVEGVDVQLPFLQTVLEGFDIVPIVMGEESPEFCRELGTAVGEVMYNRRTLLVACCDVLAGDAEGLDQLQTHLENADVSRLMTLLNSETVRVEGKGALLVALIAAFHRNASHVHVLRREDPDGERRGFLGAVITR